MIHPTALVATSAILGHGVSIAAFSIIHDGVEIGANSSIGSHCEIGVRSKLDEGRELIIGDNSTIRSHSIFYRSSKFGPRLVTGHRVTVREQTIAGDNLQIGTMTDIQGHCTIGSSVRAHSSVHIGQHAVVDDFVWLYPNVVLTNDPHPPSDVVNGVTIRRFAVIATMSVILPGVTVGEGALVGAGSVVNKNIAPHTVAVGNPAKERGPTSKIILRDGSGRAAYPWPSHFRRGYSEEAIKELQDYLEQLRTSVQ